MFKVNDIIIYNILQEPRILYIKEYDDRGYSCVEVTLTTCMRVNRMSLDSLKNLGLVRLLENRVVPEMEIMNLTDEYAEYFL